MIELLTNAKILRIRIHTAMASCAIVLGLAIHSAASAQPLQVEGLPPELKGGVSLHTYSDVSEAANNLVHFLENQGYVLASVSVAGETLRVDLGQIEAVSVLGLDERTGSLARAYLNQLVGPTPHIEQIDHVTGLINDIPGLTASLQLNRLGNGTGYEAVLVGSRVSQSGSISFHNTPTEDLSGKEVVLHQELYSLVAGGDILQLELAGAQAKTNTRSYFGQVSYQVPVNSIGSFAETRASHFDSASDFNFRNQNTLASKSTAGAVLFGHRFKRTVNEAKTGFIEMDYRVDKDNLSEDRRNAILRTSWFYKLDTDQGDTVSYGLTFSGGHEFSGAENNFGSLRAGVGLIYGLPSVSDNAEFLLELSGQLGSKNQPSFELFSFGGQDKQRGFAPFEYAGSSGTNLTLEIAETIHANALNLIGIAPFAFLDVTYLNNSNSELSVGRPDNTELASTGIGIRATFESGFSINSWLALPDHDGTRSDRDHTPEFYMQAQYAW